jgi:hypothetical protein
MARARRPHRSLTAPLGWNAVEDPAGGKICSEAAARRPAYRAGEIFLIRRVASGGRGIQRFREPAGTGVRNGARKGGDGRVHLRTRNAGQVAAGRTVDLNHARSLRSRTCAARRPFPERTRAVRICGPCEPDSGISRSGQRIRPEIADRGGLSALFVPAQLIYSPRLLPFRPNDKTEHNISIIRNLCTRPVPNGMGWMR